MVLNLNILLLSVLLFFPNLIYTQSGHFFFKIEREGIHTIKNPFENPDSVIITNGVETYTPILDTLTGNFWVYGRDDSIWQLKKSRQHKKLSFGAQKKIEIKKASFHSYLFPQIIDTTHWLHKIVPVDEVILDSIFIETPKKTRIDSIDIYFYNFSNKRTYLELIANGEFYKIQLTEIGEKKIKVSCPNTNGKIEFQFFSPFAKVGIVKYEISILDRRISYNRPFSKYFFSKESIFNSKYLVARRKADLEYYDANYLYSIVSEGILKRISIRDTLTKFKQLMIQKLSEIDTVKLRKCMELNPAYADLLIIYHPKFKEQIEKIKSIVLTYSTHINRIAAINVQAIFDHYSFGATSAAAIKKYIQSFEVKSLLLLGDDSTDERECLIPSFDIKDLDNGAKISSDYPYTFKSDPAYPEIQVGRLPFKKESELEAYLLKVVEFYKKQKHDSNILIDDIALFNLSDLENYSNLKYHRMKPDDSFFKNLTAHSSIKFLNKHNPDLIFFVGHGSLHGWSKKNRMTIDDFKFLNRGNYFNLFDISCWSGAFDYHRMDCFSEKLLKMKDKGPILISSSSGYTKIASYKAICNFYQKNKKLYTSGELLNKMKENLFGKNKLTLENMYSINLIGIPTLFF